jgi:Uncharacterised protein family (UPF0175)
MRNVNIALPDELSAALAAHGHDLSRAAFEALALPAYRERKISAAQLRQLLGYETWMEVDAFLKSHSVELEYTLEDIERDRDTHRQLGL